MQNKSNTASSTPIAGLGNRIRYLWDLFSIHRRTKPDVDDLERTLDEYTRLIEHHMNAQLANCRVLEIGHGQRPLRLAALSLQGVDITGVDLECLTFGLEDLLTSYRANGFLRALKSAVRYVLFDNAYYGHFRAHFSPETTQKELNARIKAATSTADATDQTFWSDNPGPYDFIYSEDVLEHIPREKLPELLRQIARHLTPDGIALLRPMVFTGIAGGHHIDWYPACIASNDTTKPGAWLHLMPDPPPADTFLNKLHRTEYRTLLEKDFDILVDAEKAPGLGREFLTPELRDLLRQYSDYELFSNQVTFIVRPKRIHCEHLAKPVIEPNLIRR